MPPPGQSHFRVIQRMNDDIKDPDRAHIGSPQYNLAASRSVERGYFQGRQVSKPGPSDLAATHVAPDAGIKHTLGRAARQLYSVDPVEYQIGLDTINLLVRNVQARNAVLCIQPNLFVTTKGVGKRRTGNTTHRHASDSSKKIKHAHKAFLTKVEADSRPDEIEAALQRLHDALSLAPGNLPDYGRHREFNQPVSDRYHLNATRSGHLTPISNLAADMGLDNTGVAVSRRGHYLITRQGGFFPIARLDPDTYGRLDQVGFSPTPIRSPRAND